MEPAGSLEPRVHTGVHHPADVVAGALLGTMLAQLTCRALDRGR
jgi:membrane-associated phospholipid phosphatase